MANVTISQLPTGSAITGTELVPVVQNGVTIQTTTASLASAGALNYTFLTVGSQGSLTQARRIAVGSGLTTVDGGAGSSYTINLTGAPLSLVSSGNGFQVKTGINTISNVSLQFSGSGLSIANPDGSTGNPTLSFSGIMASLSTYSGTGLLTVNGTNIGSTSIYGVSNQTVVTNANTAPTIGLASNPIIPGAASMTLPSGSTASRPSVATLGMIRFNTDLGAYEVYLVSGWAQLSASGGVTSFSAGSTGLTPNTPTNGAITLAGTLNASSGGTGATSLTGYVYGNGTGVMTASTTVPTTALSGTVTNAQLAYSSITINGSVVSLGTSTTVTASTTSTLTIGTGLSGSSFNGSSPVTIAIDSTVATLTGTQTLTNKTISGASNTLTNIGNSSLTNSSITLGTTNIALGGTSLTPAGLTSVTVTQDPTQALQLTTKQYVDAAISNVNYHAACNYATTADLGAVTYNNGSSGVGATITKTSPFATLAIDGANPSVGQRILVKNETSGQYNGIYTVTSVGSGSVGWVLTRATDYDQSGTGTGEIAPGDTTFILSGTVNASTQWVQTTDLPITVGTTPLVFVQIAGPGAYTAGTGLTLTGTQFSITNTAVSAGSYTNANITVNAQGQITSASNGAAGGVTSFSAGTTGFTPSTGSTGAITLAGTLATTNGGTGLTSFTSGGAVYATSSSALTTGTLPVASGGTGVATLTGLAYGNGTSAFTAATAAQVVAVIGSTAVTNATNATNATNLALTAGSGATNYITYAAAATGNQPQYTSTGITINATNSTITGGINGGTF